MRALCIVAQWMECLRGSLPSPGQTLAITAEVRDEGMRRGSGDDAPPNDHETQQTECSKGQRVRFRSAATPVDRGTGRPAPGGTDFHTAGG